MLRSPVLLLLLACLTGCSKKSAAVADLPVSPLSVSLSDGHDLTNSNSAALRPDFQLTDPEIVHEPLIFANDRDDAIGIRNPMILRKDGAAWKAVELWPLFQTEWVYAGSAFQRGELWAILDSTSESRGPGLYLLNSKDGGQNWSLFSALKPPALSAEFVSFTITEDGLARIIVHQDDDTDSVPRGLYQYDSTNGGKNWTGPAFTPDDLVSADPPLATNVIDTIKQIDNPDAPLPQPQPTPPPVVTPSRPPVNPPNPGRGTTPFPSRGNTPNPGRGRRG